MRRWSAEEINSKSRDEWIQYFEEALFECKANGTKDNWKAAEFSLQLAHTKGASSGDFISVVARVFRNELSAQKVLWQDIYSNLNLGCPTKNDYLHRFEQALFSCTLPSQSNDPAWLDAKHNLTLSIWSGASFEEYNTIINRYIQVNHYFKYFDTIITRLGFT